MAENEKLMPKRRFREFQDTKGWEKRKLGEIGNATGGTSIESEYIESGKYKIISIGSYSEESKYTDQGLRANASTKTIPRILNKDDLTMILNDKTSTGRIIGRVLLIDENDAYIYNQRTQRIEVFKDKYDPRFIYQLLNADNIRDKIVRSAQGNTQIYVNWSAICELEYFIPVGKSEQTAIGNFFLTLDNSITFQQCKLEKTKALKSAYLSEMFPAEGQCVPKRRFAGFTEEWEQRKLGDVIKINSGRDYKHLNDGDIPVYGTGGYMLSVDESLSEVDAIGIGRKGTIDKPQLLSAPFWTVDTLFFMTPMQNNDLLYLYALSQNIEWAKMDESTGVPSLSKLNIQNVDVCVPDKPEQIAIGNFFRTLDNIITFHQQKLDKLQNIKKAYLNEMFI